MSFADELRYISGPENQMIEARRRADLLIEKHRKIAKEQARANAESGMKSHQYVAEPPMVSGNLIPQQQLVDEIVEALRKEGLTVRGEVSIFDDHTNIKKLRVFMEW